MLSENMGCFKKESVISRGCAVVLEGILGYICRVYIYLEDGTSPPLAESSQSLVW